MSKQDQVLKIQPEHELKFVGSFKYPITSYIKLQNPSDKNVAFKIKTTAPKKYCVRPNSGILQPDESLNIAVSLQAHDFDHSEKNKHKFMVQTMFVADGESTDLVWKEDAVMGTKLKCVFEKEEMVDVKKGKTEEYGMKNNAGVTSSAPSTNEEKTKRIGDSSAVYDRESDVIKTEMESILMVENMNLKEEILRLQRLEKSDGHGQSAPMRPAAVAVQQAQPVQPVMVIIAIIVGMVGIVLGKFIL